MPFLAKSMAGWNSSDKGNFPNFLWTLKIPAIVPGTPTESAPSSLSLGITLPFLSKYMFLVEAKGAFSRKSKVPISPLFFRKTINPPPEILPA